MSTRKSRPNANPILAVMRDDMGSDDWGTTMGWAFAVCETIYFRTDDDVPAELEFRASPVMSDVDTESYPDAYVVEMLDSGEASPEQLRTAALCLGRYADWLRAAGMDY